MKLSLFIDYMMLYLENPKDIIKKILEKAMAPHSSTLAWKIPWMEEPGRLQSMGSLRVRHDWVSSLSLFTFMHWRRKWQPTPVFLPGECQGRGSLVGCCLWGCTELDTTEVTQQQEQHAYYQKNNFTIKELKYFYYLHYNSNNMNLKKNQSTTTNLKLPCM